MQPSDADIERLRSALRQALREIPAFRAAHQQSFPPGAEAAFAALAALGPAAEPAIPELMECLEDRSGVYGWGWSASNYYVGLHQPASEILVRIGTPAVPALVAALRENEELAANAVEVLAQIGEAAVPALLALQSHPLPNLRVRMLQTLGRMATLTGKSSPDVQRACREALSDSDRAVREQALALFAVPSLQLDAAAGAAVLIARLDEPDDALFCKVTEIMRSPGCSGESTVPALLRNLQHATPTRSGWLVETLATLCNDPAVLVPALIDLNRRLGADCPRDLVASVLRRWPAEAVPQLLPLLQESAVPSSQVLFQLGQVAPADKRVLPLLIQGLRCPDAGVRQAALAGLEVGGPAVAEAVPALIELVRSGDPEDAPLKVLQGIGVKAHPATPTLLALLRRPDDRRRVAAIHTLLALGVTGPEVVPDLIGSLRHSDVKTFGEVLASALARFPNEAIAPLLQELETRTAPSVVLRCLREIGPPARPAVPGLCRLFHEVPELQQSVLEVLQAVGADGASVLPLLSVVLQGPGTDQALGEAAYNWLQRLGPDARPLLPALITFARRDDIDPFLTRDFGLPDAVVAAIDPEAVRLLYE